MRTATVPRGFVYMAHNIAVYAAEQNQRADQAEAYAPVQETAEFASVTYRKLPCGPRVKGMRGSQVHARAHAAPHGNAYPGADENAQSGADTAAYQLPDV